MESKLKTGLVILFRGALVSRVGISPEERNKGPHKAYRALIVGVAQGRATYRGSTYVTEFSKTRIETVGNLSQ